MPTYQHVFGVFWVKFLIIRSGKKRWLGDQLDGLCDGVGGGMSYRLLSQWRNHRKTVTHFFSGDKRQRATMHYGFYDTLKYEKILPLILTSRSSNIRTFDKKIQYWICTSICRSMAHMGLFIEKIGDKFRVTLFLYHLISEKSIKIKAIEHYFI